MADAVKSSVLLSHIAGSDPNGSQADAEYLLRGGRFSVLHYTKDALASTAQERYMFRVPAGRPIRLKAAHVVPDVALTADNTNFASLDLSKADGLGGALTSIDVLTTQITGGGSWTKGKPVAWAGIVDSDTLAAGEVLVLKVTKTGTGVVVDECRIQVEWEWV